jgi:hypothetical protein
MSTRPCSPHPRRLATIAALAAVLAANASAAPPLSEALAGLPLSDAQKAAFARGEIVTAEPEATTERELSFAVGFVIQRPPAEIVDEVMQGAVLAADPDVVARGDLASGAPGEFADLHLPGPDAAAEWVEAKPGGKLNLSREEIAGFVALRGPGGAALQSAVETRLRQTLSARVRAYREHGLAGVGAYARGSRDEKPGDDLLAASRASGPIRTRAPAFQKVLEGYPAGKGAGFAERHRWIVSKASGEPVILLQHVFAMPDGESWGMAQRQYWVSAQYNAEQDAVLLQPVAEGTLVILMSRTSTDQVAGFGGGAKRAIGSKMMGKALVELAERSRTVLSP